MNGVDESNDVLVPLVDLNDNVHIDNAINVDIDLNNCSYLTITKLMKFLLTFILSECNMIHWSLITIINMGVKLTSSMNLIKEYHSVEEKLFMLI
jgi:hypothetical protein